MFSQEFAEIYHKLQVTTWLAHFHGRLFAAPFFNMPSQNTAGLLRQNERVSRLQSGKQLHEVQISNPLSLLHSKMVWHRRSSWSITLQYLLDDSLDHRGSRVQAPFLSILQCGYHFHVGTVHSRPEHVHTGDRVEWDSRDSICASAAQFDKWLLVIRFSDCKGSQHNEK